MARTKDPQKIPRPLNCFLLFRLATLAAWRSQGLKRQPELSKKLSEMWDALSCEEKAIYINMAKEAKVLHHKMYPDYRYRPKRNKKTAIVKIEDASSPSPSTSRSSSWASSSPSTPAPATSDTTTAMLPVGLPPSTSTLRSERASFSTIPFLPGVHANRQLSHSVQPNGHPWSPQVAGWTEPPPLPSTSTTGLHWQNNTSSLQSAETAQGFPNPYAYQPHTFFAPPQAFPALEAQVQLPSGIMNTQPPRPAPQQAVNQVLLPSQAHTVAPQPQTEPLFSEVARSSELEAWEKEFAPLDAGFCDLSSAWTNIKASAPASSAAFSPTSLTSGVTSTSASESLPSAAAYNLDVPTDNHAQYSSQMEDPLAFPSASDLFDSDPSFTSPFDPLYGQLYNPFEDLPPSAVWPEALKPFGI